jgi:hypothetical protein
MTEQLPANRGPVLAPFLLGAAGACAILFVLLYGLVWRTDPPGVAVYSSLIALLLSAAFFWSGFIRLLFPRTSHGVPAAGYAAVWAVLGLVMLPPTMDTRYITFLFVSFICLFLGRLGERAARWVFPERFRG